MSESDAQQPAVLTTVNNPSLAEIIRGALATEGIGCRLEGEGQAGLTGVLPIRLWVATADLDRAREIIREQKIEMD